MKGNAFGRVARAVTRRPLLVLALTAVLALGRRRAGAAARAERGHRDARGPRLRQLRGDRALQARLRRRGRARAGAEGELTRTVLTADLGRVLRLEGCLSGNVPDTPQGLGNLPRGLPRDRRAAAGEGRLRARHLHQHRRRTRSRDEFGKRQRANQRQATRAAEAARRLSRRRGDPPAEQERLAEAAADAVTAQFHARRAPARAALRAHGRPAHRQPGLRLHARVRHARGRARRSEVALRLPVPVARTRR